MPGDGGAAHRRASPGAAHGTATGPAGRSPRGPLLVLAADGGLVAALRAILRRRAAVQVVRTVADARRGLAHTRPAALLLEVPLPGDDGLTFLAELRQWSELPVLLLTACGSEALASAALDLRVTGYLRIPCGRAALHRAVTRLLADAPRPRAVVALVVAALRTPADLRLSPRALAARVGVPYASLCAAIRQRYGCTVGAYRRAQQVAQARRLLATTTLPITTIAARVGFRDPGYFGRVFRQATGVVPTAARRARPPAAAIAA